MIFEVFLKESAFFSQVNGWMYSSKSGENWGITSAPKHQRDSSTAAGKQAVLFLSRCLLSLCSSASVTLVTYVCPVYHLVINGIEDANHFYRQHLTGLPVKWPKSVPSLECRCTEKDYECKSVSSLKGINEKGITRYHQSGRHKNHYGAATEMLNESAILALMCHTFFFSN